MAGRDSPRHLEVEMSRLPVALILSAGCSMAPLMGESASEAQVQQQLLLNPAKSGDDWSLVLTATGFPNVSSQSDFSNGESPAALRAAADRIAGCGQREDDPLEVRIYVADTWPWTVRIHEATPGAEACLAGVLSQLPLDADLGSGARYLAARTTVAALRKPSSREVNPTECSLIDTMLGLMTLQMETDLVSPGEVALAVTCPSATPVTKMTVRYERGALVGVETVPDVPCVEARAQEALRDLDRLAIRFDPTSHGKQSPSDWRAARCTVTVPLRPLE
jgi:hypothetical protein